MTEPFCTVAVFNASEDTVEMICEVLTTDGYRCVTGHVTDVKRGELDFLGFIEREDARVIVWDIAPPYDKNWTFFQLLKSSEGLRGRGVVLTTTHKPVLDALAGEDTRAIEIIGKPYDLNLIVEAVRRATPAQARGG